MEWLKALKNSARNWRLVSRKIFVFFTAERSTSAKPGPRTEFIPSLPKVYGGGVTKAEVSKYSEIVLGPLLGL